MAKENALRAGSCTAWLTCILLKELPGAEKNICKTQSIKAGESLLQKTMSQKSAKEGLEDKSHPSRTGKN